MKKGTINSALRLKVVALVVTFSVALGGLLPVAADTKSKTTKLTEEQKILHLLNRIGYGPRPGDVEKVKRLGIEKYLDQQLHPERIDDSAVQAKLEGLESLKMTTAQIFAKYPQPQDVARQLGLRQPGQPQAQPAQGEEAREEREARRQVLAYYAEKGMKPPQALLQDLQAQKIIRAVYSERQLQEVMTDFWFNHFNIFWPKGAVKWLATDFEMNAIRPNTLGKFKDLLLATAKSPAMLFYLDNFQSSSPDARLPGRGVGQLRRPGQPGGIDDQRRRERLRQLGLDDPQQMTPEQQQRREQLLNQLRNRKPGINENYAREIMELHTMGVDGGYTQKDVQEVARCFTGWTIQAPRQDGSFLFRPFMHDDKEKVVLGHKIPAGGGIKDGEMVIEILSRHPSTAKFISTKLVRRFVSDNPPQSLVDKVAAVYTKTDGDIREMLRTVFTSKEFQSSEAYRAKIKSPFELAVSAVRALGGDTTGSRMIAQFIAKMGQPLYVYQAPTGYPDRAEQWVNTGALLERLNFGIALASNRVIGTTVSIKQLTAGVTATDSAKVLEKAIAVLLHGDVSAQTREILNKQLKEGVPVKGELGDLSAIRRAEGDAGSDAMMADLPRPALAGNRAARQDQRAISDVWGRRGDRQAAVAQVDPEIAKVFGLVLGSPEFQRR